MRRCSSHGFDLGDEWVIDLERLDGAQGRFREQSSGRRDGVDVVGLVQPTRPTLSCGALRRNFTAVEPGRHERDRGMGTPSSGAFDPDEFNAVSGQHLDAGEIAGGTRTEHCVGEFEAVRVDDADGVGVLVRVDSRDG